MPTKTTITTNLQNSKFWNTKYRNYNASTLESQDFLHSNNCRISNQESTPANTTHICSALVGFEGGDGSAGSQDKYVRPATAAIIYDGILDDDTEITKWSDPKWIATCERRISEIEKEIQIKITDSKKWSGYTAEEFKKIKLENGAVARPEEEWVEWYGWTISPDLEQLEKTKIRYTKNS